MPKKRQFNFKPLQGSATSSANNKSNNDTSPSVNERLSELRKLEGKDAAAKRRQLAESVNQRSVPPDAQRILGVSESAPPKPRRDVNARARERLRGTPGPAPPKSWMKGGGGRDATWSGSLVVRKKGAGVKAKANASDRDRPAELLRFARLTGTVDEHELNGKPSSLSHLALKTTATLWDAFDEDDYPALAEIPLRLRLRLLSYIVIYGPPIDAAALKALLQGNDRIQHLDLAGLIGHRGLGLRRIQKLLEQDQAGGAQSSEDAVADTWDAVESLESSLAAPPLYGRFSHLTHLSLSHPTATGASWKGLLSLSKHTSQLTHLSLAHWPRPTLTPNLSTATVSTPTRQEVSAGGSHYYSALDSDMEEPASLLRQLSGNLLCLQWIDLEGCATWFAALARLAAELAPLHDFGPDRRIRWMDNGTRWEIEPPAWFSIFLTNWKNLAYVRCAQPGHPTLRGLRALLDDSGYIAPSLDRRLLRRLEGQLTQDLGVLVRSEDVPREVLDVEKKRAVIWVRSERQAVDTALRINDVRKMHGTKMIVFDHGWQQTATSLAASGYS